MIVPIIYDKYDNLTDKFKESNCDVTSIKVLPDYIEISYINHNRPQSVTEDRHLILDTIRLHHKETYRIEFVEINEGESKNVQ